MTRERPATFRGHQATFREQPHHPFLALHPRNELPDDAPPHSFPPSVTWWRTGSEVA